jgi:hypothetical protein
MRLIGLLAVVMVMTGCEKTSVSTEGLHPALRPYAKERGAGNLSYWNFLEFYLDATDGQVLESVEVGQRGPRNRIRVLLRVGVINSRIIESSPEDLVIDDGDGYFRVFSKHNPKGVLIFLGYSGHQVYAEPMVPFPDGVSSYHGYIQIAGDFYLEYVYFAKNNDDHKRINRLVQQWYESVGRD